MILHFLHIKHSASRRINVLFCFLFVFSLHGVAAQYVFFNNGNFMANVNGGIANVTTFNPTTCVWEGYSGGPFSNSGRYIHYNNTSISLANSNQASNLTVDGNKLLLGKRWSIISYYLNFDSSNNNWQASTSSQGVVYYYNSSNVPSTTNTTYTLTGLDNLVATPSALSNQGDIANLTVTPPSVSRVTTTTPTYTRHEFVPTDGGTIIYMYSCNGIFYTNVADIPVQQTSQSVGGVTFNYDWSLSEWSNVGFYGGSAQTSTASHQLYYHSLCTGVKNLTVYVKATCTIDGQYIQSPQASTIVTINGVIPAESIQAQDITLMVGGQQNISFTLLPLGAYREDILFQSNNQSVANVDNQGRVYANNPGEATITIIVRDNSSIECCRTTCTVRVLLNPTSITAQSIQIEQGQSEAILVSLQPTNSYSNLHYTSNNTEIATVNTSGEVTARGVGSTTIVIQAMDYWGNTVCSTTCTVEVLRPATTSASIASVADLERIRENPAGSFIVVSSFDASSFNSTIPSFTGELDGGFHTISNLSKALFDTTNGATIKNLILDDVNIEGYTNNVGAIANQARGGTRIYNCGILASNQSTVGAGNYVGSIVGRIEDNSRVINCYSFANVTDGGTLGGIVGFNAVQSNSSNIQTMVMNCMFYGELSGASIALAPIYGGRKISNNGNTGLNNYNYYRYLSNYSVNGEITDYNCALAAEERYLNRYEFYRGILNSNRALCSWYIAGNFSLEGEIAKWVLDTHIAPYPILKPQGRYFSLANRFITDAQAPTTTDDREGKVLTSEGNNGFLNVVVNRGNYGSGNSTVMLRLPITDMDYNNYDYTYAKVVLPFYNQYFDGNYTNNKVVTGWKITSISGGTAGEFTTTGLDRYNFADRNCTQKDLYDVSGRVFAQGGYFSVPKGVTAITIEAYWGDAVYLSDATYDVVYSGNNYSRTNSANCFGTRYNNGDSYNINGSSQKVYTSLTNAMNQLQNKSSVYDQAIVLVGNYHSYTTTTADAWFTSIEKPFTIMSADLDMDNEADFCIIHQHSDRIRVNPIRFDGVWHPGIGMTHKLDGTTQMPNQGIFAPMGWFEITETALARYTEFEYDRSSKNGGRVDAPLILNNGIFEQFVSTLTTSNVQNTIYMILGGNLHIKQFAPGTHADGNGSTKHNPVNVIGGSFAEFYLSGMFKPGAAVFNDGDVMCYINGGKFGVVAGAGQEQINGNVWWKIDNAVIDEFYGGGINKLRPITGNINTTINNSHVTKFCGGPKFGSMQTGKIVTTTAEESHFGTFYGAGNGGTSLYRQRTQNASNAASYPWATWINGYNRLAHSTNGIAVQPEYEFFAWAGGSSTANVGRFYINHAAFDKAETNNVSSTLTNCTIDHDFYGGGNLGNVKGTATSILESCIVHGSVFGGGFSAQIPTVLVYPSGFTTEPAYDGNAGVYKQGAFGEPTAYTWSNKAGLSQTTTHDDTDLTIWTNEPLTGLGEVINTDITIKGSSTIDGALFGGGNQSKINGSTKVTIQTDNHSSTITNVYGGGNVADVLNNTEVIFNSGNIIENLFGGGNQAKVGGDASVMMLNGTIGNTLFGGGNQAEISGNTTIIVKDGTINGNLFGGGNQGNVVGSTSITIGEQ